jgi:hypothetical protein
MYFEFENLIACFFYFFYQKFFLFLITKYAFSSKKHQIIQLIIIYIKKIVISTSNMIFLDNLYTGNNNFASKPKLNKNALLSHFRQ